MTPMSLFFNLAPLRTLLQGAPAIFGLLSNGREWVYISSLNLSLSKPNILYHLQTPKCKQRGQYRQPFSNMRRTEQPLPADLAPDSTRTYGR
jgi:hypothetical protein